MRSTRVRIDTYYGRGGIRTIVAFLFELKSLLKNETDKLTKTLPALTGNIIFVTNETSMGIIPESQLARQFCDEAGVLHQKLASLSDRVILTVAGLPHVLKGSL